VAARACALQQQMSPATAGSHELELDLVATSKQQPIDRPLRSAEHLAAFVAGY
jgi:hypothetical protein